MKVPLSLHNLCWAYRDRNLCHTSPKSVSAWYCTFTESGSYRWNVRNESIDECLKLLFKPMAVLSESSTYHIISLLCDRLCPHASLKVCFLRFFVTSIYINVVDWKQCKVFFLHVASQVFAWSFGLKNSIQNSLKWSISCFDTRPLTAAVTITFRGLASEVFLKYGRDR